MLIVALAFLIIITSFFSASETAITTASRAKFHQMAKDGDQRAILIKKLQSNLGLVISVLLMCNTMANAIVVAVATKVFGSAYASAIAGTIVILYGEVMPKMLALVIPEQLLIHSARLINIIFYIFRPINHIVNTIASLTLKIFGIKNVGSEMYCTNIEELRGAIDLHKGPGIDVPHERAMLKGILDLGSVPISKIMVHRKDVVMIDIDRPIKEIVQHILLSPHTRFPIWQNNNENIIGVIHTKDLLRYVHKNEENIQNINLSQIAIKPWFVPEHVDLLQQLQDFRKRHEHIAIVVDEYGAYQGIVTLEDVLEEIVGDISDEHDLLRQGIKIQTDGSLIVRGDMAIRDLNRQFEWNLPDEDVTTIAGLLIHDTRMIPNAPQTFVLYGFKFDVLRRYKNQITLIKILKLYNDNQETIC